MKIICVDNFDRDDASDTLIAENVVPFYAERIVKLLNSSYADDSPNYYRAVENDYKLKIWEP